MPHGEVQENSQGTYLFPIAPDGTRVNTPIKYDGLSWTVQPEQSAQVNKPAGLKGAKSASLTKDMTSHTLSSDAPLFEAMLLPLLMTFRNRTDPTTLLTPTPDGTNGYIWETYIREGERDYMQSVFGLFGNPERHQQVAGIVGKMLKLAFASDGENQTFNVEAGAVGGKLRDPVDGGEPLLPLPAASALTDVEIDPNTICVYASDISRADLDRRAMLPQTTAAHTLANGDTAAAIATAVEGLLQGLANVNGANLTVTGAGGPLGTADVTLDIEFLGDLANQEIWDTQTEDGYGAIGIGGTYSGGTITVTQTQAATATQNEIQQIIIPSGITGDVTFSVNLGNTVLMPELSKYEWRVDNRNSRYKFARCSEKYHKREGSDSTITFTHMANDYGMRGLARVRGHQTKTIWVMLRARGPEIAGATPSRYLFEVTSTMLVKTLTDMPYKDGWKVATYDGVLATDPDFINPGVGALARARLGCTQSALFVQ